MLDTINQVSLRQKLFGLFVLFIFVSTTLEIISEFHAGETLSAMADDVLWVMLSGCFLAVYLFERAQERRALSELSGQLQKARGQLAQLDAQSHEIACQYRAVMQKQFDVWQLSKSEQDVVIGMLKGLSFREIAELRQTKEKTVRQQASSIYRKSGVTNRNELAAWFFEDMLDPP